jgi:hypothetical protein
MSTTTINEGTKGCHNRFAVETSTPRLKPLILSLTHPAKSQGEHMFIPSITVQPATMEQDVKNLEADAVAYAHLTEEKPERITQKGGRHYKGIIARERSIGEIIPIQIVGETWLEQEHRTMVIVLEHMTNGQIEVTTYNEAQGIVIRRIEDTDGHLRTVCEDLLELATIHVGQGEEEDSEEERIYMFIEDDNNCRLTT